MSVPPHPTSPQALDPPMGSADQSTSCPWFLFFLCPGARAFLAFFLFLPFLQLFAVDWLFWSFSFSLFLNSLHYFNIVPYLSFLWKQKLHHLMRYLHFFVQETKMLFPSTYSSGATMSFMLQHEVENVSASRIQKVFHRNCFLVQPHPKKDSSYSVFWWSDTP